MKNRITLIGILMLSVAMYASAQERYFTRTGKITFLSNTPFETIEAINKTASAVVDAKSGAVQFAVFMRGFEFRKALMQEHFNESFIESNKYPKAEFRGSIVNNNEVNYAKDGIYNVQVKGQLSLHGITKELQAPAIIKIQDGKLHTSSNFNVLVSDYQISIPSLVKDKVSNNVKVTVEATLEPLKI